MKSKSKSEKSKKNKHKTCSLKKTSKKDTEIDVT